MILYFKFSVKMGRKKSNPVGQLYFTYDAEKDVSTCKVDGCQRSVLKGRHSNNLETHIRSYHPDEHKQLIVTKNYGEGVKQVENYRSNDISAIFSSKVNLFNL